MRAAIIKQFVNEKREMITMNVIQVLRELGFEVELVTNQKPNLDALKISMKANLPISRSTYLLPFGLGDTFVYERLMLSAFCRKLDVDLAVDVHGDLPAYAVPSRTPLVIYGFFPLPSLLRPQYEWKYSKSFAWRMYLQPYKALALSSARKDRNRIRLMTLTKFSQTAIRQEYGLDSEIVYAPVDVSRYGKRWDNEDRRNNILVLARISPEKKIENAVDLLKKVRVLDGRWTMSVVGSLSPWNRRYFDHLRKLAGDLPVDFMIDATSDQLESEISTSKYYLHTMKAEHFGISVVEAMSGGLIPLVPDFGGPTEFVPSQFQYRSLDDAARRMVESKDRLSDFRATVHETAQDFSEKRFRERVKSVIETAYEETPNGTSPAHK
jgi:glycosyltransferase involved in cell wall biosynthesis